MSCCGSCQDKPSNHNKRWNEADEAQAILQYAAGTPIDMIAEDLGRTPVSILHRLTLHGLVEFDREENAYFTVPVKLYQF